MADDRRRAAPAAVGVVKFASCDGCQLTLLDLEDELLAITERFDIVEFPEATSRRPPGPYDVLLVEGSVSTPDQLEEILDLRRETPHARRRSARAPPRGGIQALRNWAEHDAWRGRRLPAARVRRVARDAPRRSPTTSTVDAELRGCPIDPGQLLELLTALAVGRRPQLPDEAVCLECKRRGDRLRGRRAGASRASAR